MSRRLTWLGIGLVAGFGASKWVEHKARKHLARYLPVGRLPLKAGTEMADRARELAAGKIVDLRSAVEGGRSAMAAKESELRRQLRLPDPGGPSPGGFGHGQGQEHRRAEEHGGGRKLER